MDKLVHEADATAAGVSVVKRFTGGGTVVVDENTIFASIIGGMVSRGGGQDGGRSVGTLVCGVQLPSAVSAGRRWCGGTRVRGAVRHPRHGHHCSVCVACARVCLARVHRV